MLFLRFRKSYTGVPNLVCSFIAVLSFSPSTTAPALSFILSLFRRRNNAAIAPIPAEIMLTVVLFGINDPFYGVALARTLFIAIRKNSRPSPDSMGIPVES